MAWSAHKDEEHMTEHFTDEQTMDRQASELAQLIRNSQHFVAFTGAGISTSAGIPDFRGPQGVWTMRAQGKSAVAKTSTIKACPTPGHMALKSLETAGKLKFLISQNTDGLHRRSGFPPEKIAELHGNTNLEVCRHCGKQYLRDYSCSRRNADIHDHSTGRRCSCGGELHDSIIHFGENLPSKALRDGFQNAEQADLMLVLGSSLTVSPAADMPRRVAERGKPLVICNLQKTPLDQGSAIRVFAKTDDLMLRVISKLGIGLDQWKLTRHIAIELKERSSSECLICVFGLETDGTLASILAAVQLEVKEAGVKSDQNVEPFAVTLMKPDQSFNVTSVLHFMGHYNEPPIQIQTVFSSTPDKQLYRLEFDPRNGTWNVQRL